MLDWDFDYDALNRRIRETQGLPTDRELFVDLSGNVLQEQGITKTQHVWSPVTGDLILRDRDASAIVPGLEERIYALDDGLGNVSAIVDRHGEIIQRYYYTPEGQLTITDENGQITDNGQTWKDPAYQWRYLFRTGRQDAPGTYRIGNQEWDYVQGGKLGPDADAYWSQQLAIKAPSLSAYDRVVLTTAPVAIGATVTVATFGWGAPIGYALMAGSLAYGYTNGAGDRYMQGQSTREVFEGAAYDATGFTAVNGALYNQDYMTGEDLGWSTGERWFHGIMGGVQLLGVLGAGVSGVSSGLSRIPPITVPQPAWAMTTSGARTLVWAEKTVSLAALGRSGTGVLAGPGGLAGGLDSLSRFAQSSTSGNNKAAQTGVARHKTYYAPLNAGGYRVNEAISKTIRLRPDAWKIVLDSNRTPIGVILRELKPNVARSIARGWAQLDKYEAAIKRGYPWLKNVPFLKGVDTH